MLSGTVNYDNSSFIIYSQILLKEPNVSRDTIDLFIEKYASVIRDMSGFYFLTKHMMDQCLKILDY